MSKYLRRKACLGSCFQSSSPLLVCFIAWPCDEKVILIGSAWWGFHLICPVGATSSHKTAGLALSLQGMSNSTLQPSLGPIRAWGESACYTEVLRLGQPWGSSLFMLFSLSFCRWSLAGAAADAGRGQQFRLHQRQLHRCMYFTTADKPRLPDTHHTPDLHAVSRCVSATSASKRQSSPHSTNAACLGRNILVPSYTLFAYPCLCVLRKCFYIFVNNLKMFAY